MTLEPVRALSSSSFWKMTLPHDKKSNSPCFFEIHGCDDEDHDHDAMKHHHQEQLLTHAEPMVENATNDLGILDPVPLHPSACQAVEHVPVSEIWDQRLHDHDRKALLEFSDLVMGGSPYQRSDDTQAVYHDLPATHIIRNSASSTLKSSMAIFPKSSTMSKTSGARSSTSTHLSSWQDVADQPTNPAALGMGSLSPRNNIPDCAMDPTLMQEDESTVSQSSGGNVGTKAESLVHQDRWDDRFEELKRFVGQNGHCHVPTHLISNPSLARWCKRQRYQYKLKRGGGHSTLTDEREQKLNDVNFVWDVHSSSWEERFLELLDFKMKYGHTNVPRSRGKLGSWVKSQRRQYSLYIRNEKSHLTPNRVAKMNSVGFEWVGSKSPFPRDEHRTTDS